MAIQLGAHVDQTDPIGQAESLGAQVIQINLGDPQAWRGHQVAYPGGATALRAAAAAAGVGIYVHTPFVLNLASTNNRIRIPSRKLLQQQVDLAAEIGARGVIVHGGHVGSGDDPEAGYLNWFKAIDGLRGECPVLIENTAGGSNAMVRRVAGIERLWAAIGRAAGFEQVGFCLDTCHAHASGEPLEHLAARIREITGRIDLVHANDSRDAAGSGADRHDNLGAGQLAERALVEMIVEAQAPVIVETPGGLAAQQRDLDWLRARLPS